MKHWLAGVALICLCSTVRAASLSLTFDKNVDVAVTAQRDFHAGQWLAGYEKDIAWLVHKENANTPVAYISASHLFNTSEAYIGVVALNAGVYVGAAGTYLKSIITGLDPVQAANVGWVQKLSNFTTVDGGYGWRPFGGGGPGVPNTSWLVGGKINIPIGSFFGVPGSL